jgi:hypothetical protein
MSLQTCAEVADDFRCSTRKVAELARSLGVGANLGGRAGWRFSDADKQAMLEHLRPAPPVKARRKRRAA